PMGRHADMPWIAQEAYSAALAAMERGLIARAAELNRPGGTLVYCSCSLEPEEGVEVVRDLLAHDTGLRRLPIAPPELPAEWLTADGDLRTLPCHSPAGGADAPAGGDSRGGGLDGFSAARLQRI